MMKRIPLVLLMFLTACQLPVLDGHPILARALLAGDGPQPIELRGYGVVSGLNGNGDSPSAATTSQIRSVMR